MHTPAKYRLLVQLMQSYTVLSLIQISSRSITEQQKDFFACVLSSEDTLYATVAL